MKVTAAILAAGSGTRFGGDKTLRRLGEKPLWKWSFDLLSQHPRIDEVLVICSEGNLVPVSEVVQSPHRAILLSGDVGSPLDRQASARLAAREASGDLLLIHDAARPFLSEDLVSRVITAAKESGVAPATPVIDTIRNQSLEVIDRSKLQAMQTPQAAPTEWLRRALDLPGPFTDDLAALQAAGYPCATIEGDVRNFKVTVPEDWVRAEALANHTPMEFRTGLGYDIHAFSTDPDRKLILGGVEFEGIGLDGHSDADVLTHAVVDAILGAVALGDIGQHFPNTDERWRGKDSQHFLRHAVALIRERGWEIVNLDVAMVAERPKVMKRADEVRSRIAESAGITVDRVSLKATTNERLGAIGREEGIACFATATLKRSG